MPAPSPTDGSTTMAGDRDYCLAAVRRYDYENYLATLLLPKSGIRSAFAVRALNVELSQIRDSITQRSIGEMRLLFWRDAIAHLFDDGQQVVRDSPIVRELSLAVRRHALSSARLRDLVDAREQSLSDRPFPSLADAELHMEKSTSALLLLLLQCVEGGKAGRQAANHVGKAIGLQTLLRAVPYNAAAGRCYLPMDLLRQHAVKPHEIVRDARACRAGLQAIAKRIAVAAERHLVDAQAALPPDLARKSVFPVFLPTVACRLYLARLERAQFDVFDGSLASRDGTLPFRLWYRARIGRRQI